jgi:hypothetical protein
MNRRNAIVLAALLAPAALASAQPAPPTPADPYPVPTRPPPPPDDGTGNGSAQPPVTDPATPPGVGSGSATTPADIADKPVAPSDGYNPNKPKVKLPDRPIDMPVIISSPTGWLLPAAVLYSKTAIDTGGGVTSDNRVGLGDVAEFGIATTDSVRAKPDADTRAERIQPYLTASFRLGVGENRLFEHQPGITLGFMKSFERNHDDQKTRIAELTLVASEHLGRRVAVHVGGAFWDASLQSTTGDNRDEVTLHDQTNHWNKQIRAFGGIQVEPIDKSMILVDLGWAPEFCYACTGDDRIKLRPELSWGVRYQVADWLQLDSGVRVPDIGSANLLDAQIFGGLTFTSWGLRHGVDSLK